MEKGHASHSFFSLLHLFLTAARLSARALPVSIYSHWSLPPSASSLTSSMTRRPATARAAPPLDPLPSPPAATTGSGLDATAGDELFRGLQYVLGTFGGEYAKHQGGAARRWCAAGHHLQAPRILEYFPCSVYVLARLEIGKFWAPLGTGVGHDWNGGIENLGHNG
ncbi:hypothetical protein BRADI_2g50963v3 [Brachypodium distachyon]|uniref:Uncharacterized protein n=1 Tax=Brachypodium distachyon TaxID=15368 RepID=A0A2K2DF73_BRADI|nr:hypothetical protein BRADI_2g50963v3 [Brachypodium distachyon]